MPSLLKQSVFDQPRALPVFVLADVSGSMLQDNKIGILDSALKDMIETFQTPDVRGIIKVCVITFGNQRVVSHQDLIKATDIDLTQWKNLKADGDTPMGQAFALVRVLIEDKTVVLGNEYRPTIALITDGYPTDDWQAPLAALNQSERAKKADRLALAIGADAGLNTLEEFVRPAKAPDKIGKVFMADEARKISSFIRFIQMSVEKRSQSKDKNQKVEVDDPTDLRNVG